MNFKSFILFVAMVIASFTCLSPSHTLAQGPQTTAFVNVNVIPMDTERALENQTVLVEGDRITAIGPASSGGGRSGSGR